MEHLKKLLAEECTYHLADDVMDKFLQAMEAVSLRRGDILTRTGTLDTNIYIVKEGICAYTYMSGCSERCWGFCMPGTMMYSLHSYYCNMPAFYQVEACCDGTKVMKLSKEVYDRMIAESHEFTRWLLSMAQCQMYYYEMKSSVITGDATERFLSLVKHRPEILHKVPMKTVASYLGITQQYLSNLKKKYFAE